MTISTLAASLTHERLMQKNTGGRDRPSQEEIARLAYHFYEARGRRDGGAVEDWLNAEQELTHHYR
jgi:hypothetical protein